MSLFLDAAYGKITPRTPVWIMRQAGRYMPEYRALRDKYSFWDLCRDPDLVTEVTLQPINRLGVDAAILFSDIMTPIASMGLDIEFAPGPVIDQPVRTADDVKNIRVPEAEEIAPYVYKAIEQLRGELSVPLIGFAGAPLTLATYMVEGKGSKDYALFRQFLRKTPKLAHELLAKIAEVTIRYLKAQIDAGAQALQIFDSWAGLHDAQSYAAFGARYARDVLAALDGLGVPRIYLAVNAAHLYPAIAKLPCEVVSVDWRVPLDEVRAQLPGKTLQGNLDPSVLLASKNVISAETARVLRAGCKGPHIFNLGHGIMRQTPPENAEFLVELVKAFDRFG